MDVHFTPEIEKRLNDLAATTGRATHDLVREVVVGYLDDLAGLRQTLDRRYDDLKSGRVKPIDGEDFFDDLRRREDELLKPRSSR